MRKALLAHGSAVAIEGGAVLIRGPAGAGKSDLALRLIDAGARLVADDQTLLRRAGGGIVVSAPETLRGLIEVRGLGVLRLEPLAEAPLVLLVDLVAPAAVERLPESAAEEVLGCRVPRLALSPFEASAAAKLRLARRAFASPPGVDIISR
jgi:serine kinase of HPr protein (carbohydrate metabolism regulator)